MLMLKKKQGNIMLEAVITMGILLILITLFLETIVLNRNIENNIRIKNEICRYIQKIEKIIVYNTELQEINSILNEDIYIKQNDLKNYSGGGILNISSNYDEKDSVLQINFKKENDYIRVKINGISKGDVIENCTFYKGVYDRKTESKDTKK